MTIQNPKSNIQNQLDRAFKEWAVACDALREGKQILLIRKGGIREEAGVFSISDKEFFLLPTFEHQNPALLKPEYLPAFDLRHKPPSLDSIRIESYAVVDTIALARDEAQLAAASQEHIWKDDYVRMRFDFNPYDPLFLLILRVYRLNEPYTIPQSDAYDGCRSWVTLENALSTKAVTPAIPDAEFAERRTKLLSDLR